MQTGTVSRLWLRGRSWGHKIYFGWNIVRFCKEHISRFQNPNQIHWHEKPTWTHTDQGKFHTWWMELSFVFVNISHFSSIKMSQRTQEDAGEEKDNTSKNPLSRLATCNNYGYSLNWRRQDKVGLQHEEKLVIAYAWWNRMTRRPTPMTTWKPRPTQSTWNATPDKWMCT